jgi:hypothetical protein
VKESGGQVVGGLCVIIVMEKNWGTLCFPCNRVRVCACLQRKGRKGNVREANIKYWKRTEGVPLLAVFAVRI